MRFAIIICLLSLVLALPARAALFNQTGTFGTADLFAPSSISVDSKGVIYVTDGTATAGTLKVFDASHSLIATLGLGTLQGTMYRPSSVVAAPNGTLYLGDVSRVLPMSTSGTAGTPVGDATFIDTYQIAADSASNLFVTDTGNNRVRMFTSTGTPGFTITSAAGTDLKNPFGVAVDASHIYVSDSWNNRIALFDTAGNFQSSFTALPTSLPAGWNDHAGNIAVAADGTIFASYPHNGLAAFSSTGQLLDTYSAGFINPHSIAISGNTLYALDGITHTVYVFQTPEPASLLFLGAPALLLLRKMQKRS